MKISKKVIIRRDPEKVWNCLTNSKKSSKRNKTSLRKNSSLKIEGQGDQWLITSTVGQHKLKLRRRSNSPNVNIDIDIELTPVKTRTELKLTLSGWENSDSATKKIEIPKMSLSWEKTLGKLKKKAEAV